MRYMLHIAYLLAFALSLQVFHVHMDFTEDDAVPCVICVHQADDDVTTSSAKPEQHEKQVFLAINTSVIVPHSRHTLHQARSPPTTSI